MSLLQADSTPGFSARAGGRCLRRSRLEAEMSQLSECSACVHGVRSDRGAVLARFVGGRCRA